jgi:nitric oxide reductase NorE protein
VNSAESNLGVAPASTEYHLPGEPGIWIIVVGDLLLFSLFFGVFLSYRAEDVALYLKSQQALNQGCGAINTLLLLTSSWFVVRAIHAAKSGGTSAARALITRAMLCGSGFVVVKIIECSEMVLAGYSVSTDDFFMFYFVLTGIHFLHLLIGMGVLGFMRTRAGRAKLTPSDIVLLECGASFWHLVDVLWIVLFPLLYLVH